MRYPNALLFRKGHLAVLVNPRYASESRWAQIKAGTYPRILSKAACTAPADFNRWYVAPASFMVQISIGSVYAWSMWNFPLTHELGVVASAAND